MGKKKKNRKVKKGNIKISLRNLLDPEVWVPMKYKGKETNYIISNHGRVKSLNYKSTGKVKKMKQFNHRNYRAVNVTIDGKFERLLVHRLVAENFIPVPQHYLDEGYTMDTLEVNHLNAIKHDNHYDNLEWITHAENMRHAVKNNLITYHNGEDASQSTITAKQAKEICKLLEENELTLQEIADRVGASKGVVYNIKYGLTWTDISSKYDVASHSKTPKRVITKKRDLSTRLDEYIVVEICEDLANSTLSIEEIVAKYNVSKSKVESLRYKHSWKDITEKYDFTNRNVYKPRKQYGVPTKNK